MDAGIYISGAGHGALILWALVGGLFTFDTEVTVEVTEVSLITSEEYAALFTPAQSPDVAVEVPTPPTPEIEEATPQAPEAEIAPQTPEAPVVEAPPIADEAPEVITPPVAEVTDTPPDIPQPPDEETVAVIAPPAKTATPQEAPRVAPTPAAMSAPDTRVDEVVREEAVPDPEAETVREEEDATVPEETTTEIVTEAEEPASAAPKASVRPSARPKPPVRTAEPEVGQTSEAIDEALQTALADPEPATLSQSAPAGPPLSFGEKDALRVTVSNCWTVDVGGSSSRVTVVVGVSLDRDGKIVKNSLHLISSEGGNDTAVAVAYRNARSAIYRCQKGGYDLPREKYSHWREIEMTFNPEKMRIK